MQQKTAQTDICTKKKRGVTFRERGFITVDPPPVIESILDQNGQILVTGGVRFLGGKGPFLFMSALISNPATTRFAPS